MKMGRESPSDLLAASLIDPLATPAVFLDAEGKIQYHNVAWEEWISKNPTPVFGPAIYELIDAEQRDAFATLLKQDKRENTQGEFFRTTRTGRSLWITYVHGTAKWDSGMLGLITPSSGGDPQFSEAKDTLAELGAQKARWQYAMNSELYGLWDLNLLTNERFHSVGWRRIRGLSETDRSSLPVEGHLETVHPFDRPSLMKRMKAVHSGKIDKFCDEFRERHFNGHWIWILSRGEVITKDANGRPERIIGTDTDISHLKELGGQFDDISQRLELAVTSSGIGVWEYNIDQQTVVWDQRMYDIYGILDPQALKNRNIWEDTLHPEDRDRMIAISTESVEQRKNFDLNYRIVTADGEVRHIHSTGRHYTDANGTAKLIGINWDTTHEEKQAQALRDAHAQAEQQNADLEAARAEMEYQSRHDALTNLPNRRMLEIYRSEARKRRQKGDMRSAVLHIDLDRFKQINDTIGHPAGDAVLCHVADILRNAATPNSITARVGGDEFVVFIEHAPHDALLSYWARELIREVKRPFIYNGHECRFGISIGIATDTDDELSDDALFSHADMALYQAKKEGRGQLRFYSSDLKTEALAKQQCASDILEALEGDQFQCVYQPQFDCYTLEIIGAEALVRWDHPTRGRLAPDAFLDIAEELDIVAKIDQVVFERALKDARKWRTNGKSVPQISVNVSTKRLLDPLLPARIAHLADETQSFSFELLESIFLDDPDDTISKNLACIRDLGIGIEVDDFGTGHASMVGLLNLRPDRLKIDRQLVIPLVSCQQQRRLVASIIEIGHVLGISVLAEGVETQDHVEVLAGLGCDFLQGYGLGKPMPAHDLEALLPYA